ncbi:MAG: hypothetical protein ACO3NK_04925 [Prochlorotrichaceae cyanobacterium]|jgi:hypothetical protein
MRHYSRQAQLLQQDVVKVAVKVEEMSASNPLDLQGILGVGAVAIAVFYGLQLVTSSLG